MLWLLRFRNSMADTIWHCLPAINFCYSLALVGQTNMMRLFMYGKSGELGLIPSFDHFH